MYYVLKQALSFCSLLKHNIFLLQNKKTFMIFRFATLMPRSISGRALVAAKTTGGTAQHTQEIL